MVKRLVVAVQDEFLADGKRTFTDPEFYEFYRRPGRRPKNRLCILVKIWTEIDIGFSGRKFHRKGQAGWVAAFLAVLFGQELVDIKGLEGHIYTPPSEFSARKWQFSAFLPCPGGGRI